MPGPLNGTTVVEIEGMGPVPFAAMLLADMGAEVIRVERPRTSSGTPEELRLRDTFGRGRKSVRLDLKGPLGREAVLDLAARADVLIEGFRPGVMERLGLGPEILHATHPALVYARLSGWGQSGDLAQSAGHDINYIALAGALDPLGGPGADPVQPLAMVGDFGGGAMTLTMGILAALLESRGTGQGQVVDASCVDGASLLMSVVHHMRSAGQWRDERGSNLFDGGAPYYGVYRTSDDRHVAIGAIEPKFYSALLPVLGLDHETMRPQNDRDAWPERRRRIADVFATRTRDEWVRAFDGVEACFSPVLSPAEAVDHPVHGRPEAFINVDGFPEPAPTPQFSRTPSAPRPRPLPGHDTEEVLRGLDWPQDRIDEAMRDGADVGLLPGP